jgi:hypothetical protein
VGLSLMSSLVSYFTAVRWGRGQRSTSILRPVLTSNGHRVADGHEALEPCSELCPGMVGTVYRAES